MFAKSKWFQKRKHGGWGISPKTRQGWIYILGFILVLVIFNILPFWSNTVRIIFTIIWALILAADVVRIMINLKKDELETKQEALAERNASWGMVFVLTAGILYQIISSGLNNKLEVDIFPIIALLAGIIIKSLSYVYLEKLK
ncbi:MAG: hypothetical protein GF335_03710 [Candidatus Moranbacteria bacterium]|nr:hypothetical protein [Candidatus Moranbacteria bacterium]